MPVPKPNLARERDFHLRDVTIVVSPLRDDEAPVLKYRGHCFLTAI
jgi:hypothetical protein